MNKFITVVDMGAGHHANVADSHREQVKRIAEAAARRRAPSDKGAAVSVLCAGCGTTAAAMAVAIARDVNRPVYRVDLSALTSKYIGETEKNLETVFAEAERADAVLLFEEADALFGQRTDVKDSHDRFVNAETDALLRQIEDYDGIAILATNNRQNIDDASRRRWRFVLE
jgi:SpoVK/Ycf46/Vps4 family AAA+-type ATPase